jgi:hypothetical protein
MIENHSLSSIKFLIYLFMLSCLIPLVSRGKNLPYSAIISLNMLAHSKDDLSDQEFQEHLLILQKYFEELKVEHLFS